MNIFIYQELFTGSSSLSTFNIIININYCQYFNSLYIMTRNNNIIVKKKIAISVFYFKCGQAA